MRGNEAIIEKRKVAEKESNEHLEALDFIKKERVPSARSMRLKQRHEQNNILKSVMNGHFGTKAAKLWQEAFIKTNEAFVEEAPVEAAPDEAAETQVEANEDEVEVHDPIAGEVVRVVFSKRPG